MKARRERATEPAKVEAVDRDVARVAGIAALISLFSFIYYFQKGTLLFYGDAVAHINIARRVFDSQTPGLLQLGTVWLPLPHLLVIPFIWSKSLWQSGSGGSIPSMVPFVFGAVGIFRIVRGVLDFDLRTKPATQLGAWIAVLAYAGNPNLIYMQATAMTESIYLAFFIWAVVYFSEFVRALPTHQANDVVIDEPANWGSPLMRCGWCLAGVELTRYDGWFLGGVVGLAVVVLAMRRWQTGALKGRRFRRVMAQFFVLIAAAPVLWLAYNGAAYRDPLAFANGPFSAKAIEQRVAAPNPALHNPAVAAIYFMKSAQLNMADGNWGRFWLLAGLVALAIATWKLRAASWATALFWVPLPFYALSIAYGSVPLHVQTWWPFVAFNQRYGLQMLPMFAVSAGLMVGSAALVLGRHTAKITAAIAALIALSYVSVWALGPQCFQEAQKNWDFRHNLNSAVQRAVEALPPNSVFLMDLSEHVGLMEQAGIPLRRVVNSQNHRTWKYPSDPEGLWERALADPAHNVDYVITFDGDAVDRAVNRDNLNLLMEIHVTGQPHARLYAARTSPNQSR